MLDVNSRLKTYKIFKKKQIYRQEGEQVYTHKTFRYLPIFFS